MKKIALFTLLIVSFTFAKAQVSGWGPKAGMAYSMNQIDETFTIGSNDYRIEDSRYRLAPIYGVYGRLFITNSIFLKPEWNYAESKINADISSLPLDTTLQLRLQKVDIPLLFGYSKNDITRFYAGPVYSKQVIKDPFETDFFKDLFNEYFKNGYWALQVGISHNISDCVIVEARYETNLSKITQFQGLGLDDFQYGMRTHMLTFSIGLDLIDAN